ncbi:hypothetical protein TNCV_4625651 [Trichonephila clavipes]|nr:hypothetical protein TNCV_4625651 [Trichonephila clavipes]
MSRFRWGRGSRVVLVSERGLLCHGILFFTAHRSILSTGSSSDDCSIHHDDKEEGSATYGKLSGVARGAIFNVTHSTPAVAKLIDLADQ